jgi:hypothetical protein
MANKSMTPKSMGYKCGGKVKHNTGGDVHMKRKNFQKGGSACCAASYLHEAANVQKGKGK